MGLRIQRKVKVGKKSHINISNSGASASVKIGRVTLNSRGRNSIRIAKGISFKF